MSTLRLGKKNNGNDNHKRPLKVVLPNAENCKNILDNTSKLKAAGATFEKIYIKKDTHPVFRKEFARIRKVEKEEREKPENQGLEVKYDRDARTLSVNGIIIDRYQPHFF